MKSFEYTIKEPVGLHARPAGMLNKEARKYKSAIIIHHSAHSTSTSSPIFSPVPVRRYSVSSPTRLPSPW